MDFRGGAVATSEQQKSRIFGKSAHQTQSVSAARRKRVWWLV